jgi:hypothetical protein
MVYKAAAKKTAAYMLLSLVVSLAFVTFLSGELNPATGRVTSTGTVPQAESSTWVIFLLGLFAGALIVGTYTYIVHLDKVE